MDRRGVPAGGHGRPGARVPGDPDNLKVTLPADLARARRRAGRRPAPSRTGIGHDSHPFGPGDGLALGGIDDRRAPRGCTATPTATSRSTPSPTPCSGRPALGDLGRLFPAGDRDAARHRQRRAPASRPRAGRGGRLAARRGGRHDRRRAAAARRPPRRDARRDRRPARLSTDAVNVKASTGNLDGAEGAGRSIARSPRDASRAAADDPPAARHPERRDAAVRAASRRPASASTRCGPTVYGPAHIGNFRSFLFADLLVRHLRWRGLPGDLGHEHHRHRRQDHPGRRGRGHRHRELAERYLERVPRRRDRPAHDDARRPAPGDRAHRPTSSPSSRSCSSGVMPIAPTTARSSSGSPRGRPTGAWRGSIRSSSGSASASRPTSTARTTSATSRSGRARSRASRRGTTASAPAGPAGTSSARR